MALADMRSVFSMLFTAPIESVITAEKGYRQLAIQWLESLQKLVDGLHPPPAAPATHTPEALTAIAKLIESQIAIAPTFKLNALIEAGVTMRIASVSEQSGKVDLKLGLGAFSVGGGFGFSQQTSSESVLQAMARYSVSNNTEIPLKNYLENLSLKPTNPTELTAAVAKLKAVA